MIFKISRPRYSIPNTYRLILPILILRDRYRYVTRYRDSELWYLEDGEVEKEREPMRRRREKVRLTSEQKASMREYAAETLEWSLQGHNEEELIQFCSDIRIVPQVFKVWMRNNRDKYMDADEASSVDEILFAPKMDSWWWW
ncbi:hypothetical protein CsSME_00048371 [Camellia sinensis var. sinensis]|uniref:zinc-finger homeodomain protein 4-like n=1 Tax=Camellia sinensis TaxID=4442 RepID=UPI001035DDA7|nr:zinc-finger homeodomain protein 4-like [Camellia sinensis]